MKKRKRMKESEKSDRAREEKGETARTNEEIEMKQNRNLANTEKYTSKLEIDRNNQNRKRYQMGEMKTMKQKKRRKKGSKTKGIN